MNQTAKAQWMGNLKEGKGTLTTQSGVLNNTLYSFKTRFESGEKGTNPEELIAAALAGCFTMEITARLSKKDYTATVINTEATITLTDLTLTRVHLIVKAQVPGITAEEFKVLAKDAELNCIVSKALKIPITSEAHFIEEKEKAFAR